MDLTNTDYLLVILVISGLLLYFFFNRYKLGKNYVELLDNEKVVNDKFQITQTLEQLSIGNNFLTRLNIGYGMSFYFEIYPHNVKNNDKWIKPFDNLRPIIRYSDTPHIYYNHKTSEIELVMKYKDKTNKTIYKHIKFNIYQQTWNNIRINIKDRDIQIYLNDTLIKRQYLENIPIISKEKNDLIKIGEVNNNFKGKLRNMRFYY